jgi:hypothetical protein
LSKLIRVFAVINGFAVIVMGAARLDWPTGFWTDRTLWIFIALVLTAIVPIVQVVVSERGEKARRLAMEREQKIETFLVASLVYAVRHAGADWVTTGIQAFVIKGWWRWRRHVRVAKVRLGAIPSSGIVWTEGKGVIGKCWETRTPQFENLHARFAPYQAFEKAEWDALPSADRFGLTYVDFQRLGHKYGVVAAVPIVDRRERYVGCVTADTPHEQAQAGLDREAVLDSLASTAQLVREVL